MKTIVQTSINWNQATEQVKINKTNQEQRLQDFLEESHEMTDARDLQYWIGETGKPLSYLISVAEDLAPNIKQPLLHGCDLDDIWNIQPSFPDEENEGEEWECNTFKKIWADLMQ